MNGKHDFLGKRSERKKERDVEVSHALTCPSASHTRYLSGVEGCLAARHCVHTDDLPIVLCALHAGFVTWSDRGVCRA